MARKTLRKELIATIEGYLNGTLTKQKAQNWAAKIIAREMVDSNEDLLEDALLNLVGLDNDPRFDTPKEDLKAILACLRGERLYEVKKVYLPGQLKPALRRRA
jgi:hypothetical protein